MRRAVEGDEFRFDAVALQVNLQIEPWQVTHVARLPLRMRTQDVQLLLRFQNLHRIGKRARRMAATVPGDRRFLAERARLVSLRHDDDRLARALQQLLRIDRAMLCFEGREELSDNQDIEEPCRSRQRQVGLPFFDEPLRFAGETQRLDLLAELRLNGL